MPTWLLTHLAAALYAVWIAWMGAGLWYGGQIDKINLSIATGKEQAYLRGNQQSTAYQAEIARQKSLITNLDRMLKHEVAKYDASCAVNDDIVRLWRETFMSSAGGNASR